MVSANFATSCKLVIRNHVFIVKFHVIVVVYVATSLVNKDKG